MVKFSLHFDPEKPHVFIESVKDAIETQYRNENRAVFGKSPYRLRKGFEHFLVNNLKWSSMTVVQRLNKVKEFQKADMRLPKDYFIITALTASQCSTLSVTAMESGNTKIPIVILATMFEKVNKLLWHEDLIVRKPDTDERSNIVARHTNQIYCVKAGKGGSFKCVRNCVNARTKRCEHTIAAAEKYGKLPDFIIWYKRSKSGASITKMALGGAPKTAGRNPSTRKRSNCKRPATILLVYLLEDCNDQLSNQNDVPPMQISTAHPLNHIVSNKLCINHLFNKIISSHRYREKVSFLNG